MSLKSLVLFTSFRPFPVETFTHFQKLLPSGNFSIFKFWFFLIRFHLIFLFLFTLQGYLKALGMARTAEVKRDARIGEAEARADSQIKEAIAEEERLAARLVNDIEIAKAQRDFELKKAAYDQEVQAKVCPFKKNSSTENYL